MRLSIEDIRRVCLGAVALVVLCGGVAQAAVAAKAPAAAAGLKAGVSAVVITPERPSWMSGFSARTKRSEGKYQDLFVKVLALEDDARHRAVIITADLVGVPAEWREPVLAELKARFALEPAEVLVNASHTHCGPAVSLWFNRGWDPEYTAGLARKTVAAVAQALGNLEPVKLSVARGSCTMSVNRRRPLPDDPRHVDPGLLPNPQGATDPDVPVLQVRRGDGSTKAVVFLFACHPTTMGGYLFGGDYAGFAQQFIQQEYPGAVALFLQGCGGDIKPRNVGANGRFKDGPLPVVEGFGRELAQAVVTALAGSATPVAGPIRVRRATIELPLQGIPSRQALEARAGERGWRGDWARKTLDMLRAGKELPRRIPETVQVVRVGEAFALVALSGEVCVDYGLRIKREEGRELWVAGYSNDLPAYIPSARMIAEGGYEAERSLQWYGLPAPLEPAAEAMILGKVQELLHATRVETP
jgi:hypothetical protein